MLRRFGDDDLIRRIDKDNDLLDSGAAFGVGKSPAFIALTKNFLRNRHATDPDNYTGFDFSDRYGVDSDW
ncbi:unnamed protein product, partial [Rotaria sp. Silwood1]